MGVLSRDVYMVSGGVTKFARAHPDNTFQIMVKEAFDDAIKDIPEFISLKINKIINSKGEIEYKVRKVDNLSILNSG